MKKSRTVMVLVIFLICIVMLICFIPFGKITELKTTPQPINEINYNNYLEDNRFDYKGDSMAWNDSSLFKSLLTVCMGNNEQLELDGVCAPFQLADGGVVYRKDHTLMYVDIDTKKHNHIADGVDRFMVYNDLIIYSTVSDESKDYRNELRKYDMSLKTDMLIYEGVADESVAEFYIHGESLFAVDENAVLIKISLDRDQSKEIIRLPIKAKPLFFMPLGDKLLYKFAGSMFIFDPESGDEKQVMIGNGTYVNDRISFICNDSNIYVSFQATKTNGSIVQNIDDENNGLWSINPTTLQKNKICSEVFDRLYLFGDNLLFGTINDNLYSIDTASKHIAKITE